MNADDLELLVRRSLEREAATQPAAPDLHQRSVASGRRLVRRRSTTAAALALIVAFVAVLSVAVSGGGRQPKPAVQPTPTLTSIADHVARLGDEGQKTSPWWYERITGTKGGRTDVAELWQSRGGDTDVLLDGSSTNVVIDGMTQGNVGSDASWATYDLRDTTPETFYSRMQESAAANLDPPPNGPPPAGDVFARIESLLQRAEFPPASRATLLRALALVPSVELRGFAPDATGRQGVVVVPPNSGATAGKRYLLDPGSGVVTESQTVDGKGRVLDRTTFVASAAVPKDHALPPGLSAVTPHTPAPLPSGEYVYRLP